jgi:hypothetical protein
MLPQVEIVFHSERALTVLGEQSRISFVLGSRSSSRITLFTLAAQLLENLIDSPDSRFSELRNETLRHLLPRDFQPNPFFLH